MSRFPNMLYVSRLFVGLVVFFILTTSIARAEFVGSPDADTLTLNGTVSAMVATTSAIYLGGAFTMIGPYSGYLVPVTTANGTASTTYPQINGTIKTIVSDGSGGWYIGGQFTQVASSSISNLVHILSNGSIDTTFAPSINGQVNTVALSSDRSTLYVGGGFTTLNSATVNGLGAVSATTGTTVSAFAPVMPALASINGMVLSSDNSKLYIGGQFATINGVTYNNLAAVTTVDGAAVSSFNPNVNSNVSALALTSDNSKLYFGGQFSLVGGNGYNKIAAVTTIDGVAISAFNPNADSTVSAIALSSDETRLYVGGLFTAIGASTYNRLAEVLTSNGAAVSAFNPNMNGAVSSLLLSTDNSKIYVGGSYTAIGSSVYGGLALIATSTGAVDGTFAPNLVANPNALALSSGGTDLFVGGSFLSVGGSVRNRLASVDITGKILSSFNPNMDSTVSALVLSPDGTKLYAGGSFTSVAGVTYNRLAGITVSTGAAISAFNPNMVNPVTALAISSDGATLYAGGSFTTVNGATTRNRLAAFTTSNGTVVSAFNPNMSSSVSALALTSDNAILYAGGAFSTVNGATTRNRLAAFTTSNGTVVSAFNPNMGATVSSLALSSDGTKIYAGGTFTTVGVTTYNRLAGIATSTGAAISAFNPNLTSVAIGAAALALTPDNSKLYVGGLFTAVGATTRANLAAITTADGAVVTGANPSMGATVSAIGLLASSSKLYAAGSFTSIGSNVNTLRFAVFSSASTTMSKTAAAVTEGTVTDSYTLVLNAPPSANVTVTLATTTGLTVSTSTLTFTSSNYATPQTVTVSAAANDVIEGTHSGTISHTVTSSDEAYNGFSISSVSVTITDSTTHLPTVSTQAATSVSTSGATLNGTIVLDGIASSTIRGFAYGLTTTYGATTTENGTFGTGAFTATLTGLTANTTYHVRAYATSTAGMGYGSDITLTTDEAAAVATTPVQTHSSGNSASSQVSNLISIGLYDQARIIAERYGLPLPLPATPVTTSPTSAGTFSRSLSVGVAGTDVRSLQVFLNTHGFVLARSGPGSPGSETTFFGSLTRAAVIRFQKANNIYPPVGYFGPITREVINSMK